jgi:hypothetical protein
VYLCGDIMQPFIPFPVDKIMFKVNEDMDRINAFLDKLATIHTPENKKNQPVGLCLKSAIEAGMMLL